MYRRSWKHIASFLDNEGLTVFSEEAGLRFLNVKYSFSELEEKGRLTQSIINQLIVVRMLGDFQQHGSVLRRYHKQKVLLCDEPFQQWLKRFERHCQEREYSVITCNHYRKATDRFLTFVESQNLWDVTDIIASHVPVCVKTLLGYSYKSVELQLRGLRCFLCFLILQDVPAQPLLDAVPTVKARKQNRIPSVWTKENVDKLIQAIDQGNPAAERD